MDPFKPIKSKPRLVTPPRLTIEMAEAVALQAMAFIAADDELLSQFLAASGCDVEALKRRVTERYFLAGVLDFVLADESTVVAFSRHIGFSPETPMLARELLGR